MIQNATQAPDYVAKLLFFYILLVQPQISLGGKRDSAAGTRQASPRPPRTFSNSRISPPPLPLSAVFLAGTLIMTVIAREVRSGPE